jgi:GT2 family glycosyltransferase
MKNGKRTFAIGIPTINRLDLLLPTLLMYGNDMPNVNIIVYDNGAQNITMRIWELKMAGKYGGTTNLFPALSNIDILGGEGKNIGVAGAWNAICEKVFEKHDFVLMLNDDIYLGVPEIEIEMLLDVNSVISGFDFAKCEEPYDWSVFLLPKKTFERVPFDTNYYPAYYEDADAAYRMKMLKMTTYELPALNPRLFRRSMTMLKDPEVLGSNFAMNRKYYIKKWGGDRYEEKFKTPFSR